MRTIVTIAMVVLLTTPCLAVESDTKADEAKTLSSQPSIIFADQELEKAKGVIDELKAQLADRERIISTSLSASAREATAARFDADKGKTEIDRLHKEIDHLNGMLAAKNEELSPAKVAGEELVEDVLGPITVSKVNSGKMFVTVPANVDLKADTRFLGAVIEKKRAADKVVYVLDASKLANKGKN